MNRDGSDASRVKVALVTLGCPKNEVDSERMAARVRGSAYRLVDAPDEADVVIVNTCSFIKDATEESIATVMEYATSWRPAGADRRLIVAGCMPSRYGRELTDALPEADAMLPVADEDSVLAVIERLTGAPADAERAPQAALRSATGPSAYLRISDGCHRACTYCTIPSIRGPYRSVPLDDLLTEARNLIATGARELVLIGQDVSAWGRDLAGGETLADVLDAVAALDRSVWIRLMYVQPDGVNDRLLSAIARNANVVRYLDMPLQHASRSVLRAMARTGSTDEFLALLERIRSTLPGVVLRTTVIAGFPGETRADATELMRFLEKARFDYVGVFPYSREDGTRAARIETQVPARTRRARAQRLRDLADDIGVTAVEALVGSELDVLVTGFDEDEESVVGRWYGQAPEIDGLVLLDGGETGDVVRVSVVDAIGYDLVGERIT